jgi:hypothetical protein
MEAFSLVRPELEGDFACGRRHVAGPLVRGDFATGLRTVLASARTGDFATGMRGRATGSCVVGCFAVRRLAGGAL